MTLPSEDLRHILDKTGALWEPIRNQRLFLTGATGFFGCWLLESLLAANDEFELAAEATVLTRHPDRFAEKAPHLARHPAIRLLKGDVTAFEFPSGEFSLVVHAATTSSAPVPEAEHFRTIVEGTARVLKFAKACGDCSSRVQEPYTENSLRRSRTCLRISKSTGKRPRRNRGTRWANGPPNSFASTPGIQEGWKRRSPAVLHLLGRICRSTPILPSATSSATACAVPPFR